MLMTTSNSLKSYSSQTPFWAMLREVKSLLSVHFSSVDERVGVTIDDLDRMQAVLASRFGLDLSQLDILDIGAGQFSQATTYFAAQNRVIGIDMEVIAPRLTIDSCWEMLRSNGLRRTSKTLLRKSLGIDRRYRKALKARLGLKALPKVHVQRMDACALSFADVSFDFIHSRSVFHHLVSPEQALAHVARVLRPGGVAYLSFHLYTSETGSLDPRVFTEDCGAVSLWPHLRPSTSVWLTPNAFVNKLRLSTWREICQAAMPGAEFVLNSSTRPGIEADAVRLRERGDLGDYTTEELVTSEVIVMWQKPIGKG
jgi:SAM-dependent methyltransferase